MKKPRSRQSVTEKKSTARPVTARAGSLTRQNVHHLVRGLIEGGIIETTPDGRDPRRSLYHLSDSAGELRNLARTTMINLERRMKQRIGATGVKAMRAALDADSGPDLSSAAELPEVLNSETKPSRGSVRKPGRVRT